MSQTLQQMIRNLKAKFSRPSAQRNDADFAALRKDPKLFENTHPGADAHDATNFGISSPAPQIKSNGMPGEIDISLQTRTGVKIATPPPPSLDEIFSVDPGTNAGHAAKPTAPHTKAVPNQNPKVENKTDTSTRPLPKAETTARHEANGAAHGELEEFEVDPLKSRKLGFDLAIVAAAMLAIGGSAFFFFGDSFFSGKNHGLTAVGKITKSHKDVRRKVDGGLSWGTVASADKVYEGDSVFTGEGSDAMIQLDKGGQIAVDPKSLIVIRTKGNKLEVDLQYGSLEGHVQNNQPLLLKQGNEVKTIEGKDAQVRIVRAEKSHKTTIQVMSGELKVQNKVVNKNEFVELEKDQAPVITKVQLSLVSPPSNKTLWLPIGKTVDFTWTSGKPGTPYVFEISKSTSFEHPVYNATVQANRYELAEESRPAGEFYWRVRPAQDGLPSLPAHLTVYSDLPPKLVSPSDAYAFTLPSDASSVEIPLTWEDNAGSTAYHIQVASDPEFKSIVTDEKSNAPHFKTKALAQGHYAWRVMGTNAERVASPWSRTQTFSVDAAAKPVGVPSVTQNDWNYQIPEKALRGLNRPLAPEQGVQAPDLQPLAWPAVAEATGYQVEVSSNPEFANASVHSVIEPSFVPDQVHPGLVYMRVRSKDAGGRMSDPSETAKLKVSVAPPKIIPITPQVANFESDEAARTQKTKHDFNLQWSPQVFADQYELQWGSDSQFTRSKNFRVKGNAKQITVTQPMPYAARVRALDSSGAPISEYSQVIPAELRKVVAAPKKALPKREVAAIKPIPPPPPPVTPAPPIEAAKAQPKPAQVAGLALPRITAPILREPQPQSSLISLESSPTFVDFKWRAVKGANFYVLEIAKDADFQSKIAEIKVQSASFVFQKPLPEGHVFWRVRYQKGRAQSDWSDVSDLNVIYQ